MKKAVHFGPTPGAFGVPLQDITDQCTFSWNTAPTTIDSGTFPDSFLDKDHTTKLAFTSTYGGAGYQAKIFIDLPEACHALLIPDIGAGAQVGTDDSTRKIYFDFCLASEKNPGSGSVNILLAGSGNYSERLIVKNQPLFRYGDKMGILFQSSAAGDFKFEIFSIRILKIVGL